MKSLPATLGRLPPDVRAAVAGHFNADALSTARPVTRVQTRYVDSLSPGQGVPVEWRADVWLCFWALSWGAYWKEQPPAPALLGLTLRVGADVPVIGDDQPAALSALSSPGVTGGLPTPITPLVVCAGAQVHGTLSLHHAAPGPVSAVSVTLHGIAIR